MRVLDVPHYTISPQLTHPTRAVSAKLKVLLHAHSLDVLLSILCVVCFCIVSPYVYSCFFHICV
jgi:hypothetical protein